MWVWSLFSPVARPTSLYDETDCSQWRLFFAGLYPVEFRDFFLGDMYCSLSYAMCVSVIPMPQPDSDACLIDFQNIELFFCLYAHSWDEPQQCNSNHSRLLGFFACLPPMYVYLTASMLSP